MSSQAFRFDNKHVVVLGGATGMGAAAVTLALELGATVTVLDVAEMTATGVNTIRVDLRDKASVDTATAAITTPVDALICCAGVADGTAGIERINFIAHQRMIDNLLAAGAMVHGGAIAMVSSVAGLGWLGNLAMLQEFLALDGWDEQVAWINEHEDTATYRFSKEAMNAYVSQRAFPLLRQGIRINAILPGPTDTPLARANSEVWLGFGTPYRTAAGVAHLRSDEMANVLLFLASEAASGVNGVTMLVDQGQIASGLTDSFPDPIVKAIAGSSQ
jgi:NAD(P)-dependent dehydrogenase (short-subunit alcohol dehydrogenase family)